MDGGEGGPGEGEEGEVIWLQPVYSFMLHKWDHREGEVGGGGEMQLTGDWLHWRSDLDSVDHVTYHRDRQQEFGGEESIVLYKE